MLRLFFVCSAQHLLIMLKAWCGKPLIRKLAVLTPLLALSFDRAFLFLVFNDDELNRAAPKTRRVC